MEYHGVFVVKDVMNFELHVHQWKIVLYNFVVMYLWKLENLAELPEFGTQGNQS
jgi:hypothetical protein